ncbi:thioredoxin family protein [Botryobacter ruber]|uniref:thioredoxin family protein n=1 Tax=Botryobacter ruber TaxID=2171629 RepID=UPI000E0AF1BF|nr:thioredoxin family protein [Botryobacter ruber]
MTITESNDNHLRQLIFEKPRVIVKYTDEECLICKELSPSFASLSSDPTYGEIVFVRMNAKENPVSSKEVKLTGTPFFATYKNGTLLECGVVSTEEGIKAMLAKLLEIK